MTNEQTIMKAITLLKTNYQGSLKNINEDDLNMLIELWLEFFKNIPEADFNKAIRNIINKYDYFPTVSQIKKEIATDKVKDLPKAEDEWQEVIRIVHKYGTYRQKEAMEHLKPYTAYIVSHIDYQHICMSEDNTWNKKTFLEEYEQMKDKEIENLQLDNSNSLKMLGE